MKILYTIFIGANGMKIKGKFAFQRYFYMKGAKVTRSMIDRKIGGRSTGTFQLDDVFWTFLQVVSYDKDDTATDGQPEKIQRHRHEPALEPTTTKKVYGKLELTYTQSGKLLSTKYISKK